MVFFISDSLSALGSDISVRESVGSRADEGSDMNKAMLGFFLSYTWNKTFRKLTNYNVMLITERDMIFLSCVIHFFFILARLGNLRKMSNAFY